MNVSFEEIGHISATFATDSAQVGTLCKMAENGKVAPCEAGNAFCGKVESVRKGFAGVQLHGFAEVAFTGSAPKVGYQILVADGNGGVKVHTAGESYLVVSVDDSTKTAIIEL